jgi:hypothetical protein
MDPTPQTGWDVPDAAQVATQEGPQQEPESIEPWPSFPVDSAADCERPGALP